MILNLFKRLLNHIGWHTLLSLLLLTIFLSSMSYALSDMLREAEPEWFIFVALAGMFLGWVLAAAEPVPGRLAALLSIILGVELVILQVGNLIRPLVEIGQSLVTLGRQLYPWSVNVNIADTALPLQLTELWLILNALFIRLWNWFAALPTSGPTFDPIVTLILWSLVLWGVSVWAAWGIRRLERPLLAIIPAGTILATAVAFSLKQIDILLLMLGATLLLIGLTRNYSRERRWQTNHIDFAPDIRQDTGVWVAIIALTLVMTAWLIPSFSVRQISGFARQFLGNKIGQVEPALGFTNKREPTPDRLKEVRAPRLPQSHLLGSGPELSDQIALIISTGQAPVEPADAATSPAAPRYYWRSLTYDVYTGRGWHTGQTQQIDYKAGEITLSPYDLPGRHILRQTVQNVGRTSEMLYAAGDLVTVDQNFSVNWRGPNDAFATTTGANTYQVNSLVNTTTEAELRAAGTNYPDRILKRYLFVPQGVPARVKTLAQDLTATSVTPYDRAKAIETHLRTYPYTLDLPAPPTHRDIVDYFLFDLQQGYCDYYATSMVVLARSVGLPARLAIGYATGSYNPVEAHYLVTEAEAHSWPEIYFPNYGWVRFEPTAARPVSTHTEQASLPEIPNFPQGEEATPFTTSANSLWMWILVPVGVLLMLAAGSAVWLLFDTLRLRRLAPATAVTAVYNRLYSYGKRLSTPTWQGNTPHEFAQTMTSHIEAVAREKRWQKTLIPATQEVQQLTNLYVQTTYSSHPPNQTDQRQAIKTWQRLRWRMWLAWASARADTLLKNPRRKT